MKKIYSPPLDSGLLQERFRKLTPALSGVGGGGGNKLLWNNFKSIDSFSISPVFTFKTILKDKMYLKVNNRDLVGL